MSEKPLIGITMGDPAGIGPEIIVKALAEKGIHEVCRPVVLGDLAVLSSTIPLISREMGLNIISDPSEAQAVPGMIDLLAASDLKGDDVRPGRPTVAGGKAMVEYILRAVEMIRKGSLQAMVTCPISKILMHQAGFKYDGHTQLISHLTNTDEYVMMLAGDRLRVSLVTTHCALKDVPAKLSMDKVHETIVITARALLRDFV